MRGELAGVVGSLYSSTVTCLLRGAESAEKKPCSHMRISLGVWCGGAIYENASRAAGSHRIPAYLGESCADLGKHANSTIGIEPTSGLSSE